MNGIALPETLARSQPKSDLQAACAVSAAELWFSALSATLIPLSLIWDFSWESSIGVDRFWSPPHLATYVGVWLSGLLAVRLIFRFSFSRSTKNQRAKAVRLGAFSAPSGAWIILWGALLVQVTLPLDNWWQQTYGLGAGLWPPPQILKTIGFFSILGGGIFLCSAARFHGRTRDLLLSWHGGLLLTLAAVVFSMTNLTNRQHTAFFYLVSCSVYPAILLGAGRASSQGWSCAKTAFASTILVWAMVWLLPLFPAHPLTPPIHNHLTRMMPPQFPLLLLGPALVFDLLRPYLNRIHAAVRITLLGLVFFSIFAPIQWLFAQFLLSPGADNWFFAGGGKHWPYFLKIDQARTLFWGIEKDPLTFRAIILAIIFATASAWLGSGIANVLKKLRR
jgi:hypothetical protein